jgi:uncharacterized protein YcaQ
VPSVDLSAAAARRIALRAQGFGAPRPSGPVTAARIRRTVEQLGLLQLDSVNVLIRSHYLPLFSRLGSYPRSILDRLAAHTAGPVDRAFVEYWAHEASLIPVRTHPLLRWRMAEADTTAWGGMRRVAEQQPELLDKIRAVVAERGPVRAADLGLARPARVPGQMWNWHDGKVALEYLFWSGEVAAARRINFERRYDLTERVLPASVTEQPTPTRADAQRELVRIAARAYGIATEPDLGDYFRLPRGESKLRVAELVEAGDLLPATVRGWRAPAYLWPAAPQPRQSAAHALLSPFDPLIWFRERALRLFGFHYRVEIYTPAAQRVHGYYVLPYLLGDTLVARVDLKSDRARGRLLVQAAWAEPDAGPAVVAPPLAADLAELAAWLELDRVEVVPRGDLAPALAVAVRA